VQVWECDGRVCKSPQYLGSVALCEFFANKLFQVDAAGKSCAQGGGTIVLESHDNVYGPGGQGVYNDPVEGWVLYYHYVDTNIGYADGQKQFGWNKIAWKNGWPTV
jgi:arabinan endo-1,5-alpha-L-arabinosidase